MKKRITSILIAITLATITFLICMKSPTDIFTNGGLDRTDSNVFKYIGLSMTKGYVPYLNLFDHKGLILYFINYIGMLISRSYGVWMIELVFMFISVLFSYKLARKFVSKPASLIVTTIVFSILYEYFEGGNLTEEYALPFQLISLNIFFDFFLNPKKYSSEVTKKSKPLLRLNYKFFNIPVFICGICFSSVLFLRANMISVWIVFAIMVLIYCIANKKYMELLKFIFSFLCGILIITIPIIIYLIRNGAFESFIKDYILFNIQYSSSVNKIDKINAIIFFFNTAVTSLAFIIMATKICIQLKNKEKCYFNIGYLVYMFITLLLIGLSGFIYGHYGMTLVPSLIYPYCVLYQFLDKKEIKKFGLNLIVTGYLLHSIIIPVGLKFSSDCLTDISNRNEAAYFDEVMEYIINNTEADDLITVFGNSTKYYNLTNRKSASKYFYQTPIGIINKEFMDEYIEELRENKPKLIIWEISSLYNTKIDSMREFLEENNYELVKDGVTPIYAVNGEE